MRDTAKPFDTPRAASYDEQRKSLAALQEALLLCLKAAFSVLPEYSRILCVGAGTGPELLALAHAFPAWRFTVVEPAGEMMKVCRAKAEQNGVAARCIFHQGCLHTLPETAPHEGATSLLVSHFIMDLKERTEFFAGIARRMAPGGHLVNADIAADMAGPDYARLVQMWLALHRNAGIAGTDFNADYLGRDVAPLSNVEMTSMLHAAGFTHPVPIYQSVLIRAWDSIRTP